MANIDYGQIIKRSKDLVWKNKWLWVYGLVLAAMGGGSSGSSGSSSSSSSSSSSTSSKTLQNVPTNIPEKAKDVLGAATTAIHSWLVSVPISTWVLIGFGLLILVIIGVGFSMFVQNWAKGALISGIDDADAEKPVTLMSTSPRGIASVKRLIIYSLIVAGLVLGIVLAVFLIFGIGFAVLSASKAAMLIWGIIIGIIGVIVIVATLVLLGFASVYADRLIVLKGMGAKEALKKGFSLAKGNFMPTVIMSIINGAIGCAVGCAGSLVTLLILGIPAAVIIIPAFVGGLHMPSIGALVVLGILVFIFINANIILRAGMVAFSYSNWNLFVKEILKQEEKI